MKKCSKCKVIKSKSEFSKRRAYKDGLKYYCKSCSQKINHDLRRTKEGVVQRIYDHQKQTSKRRNHLPPTYTKLELKWWMFSQPIFHNLFKDWEIAEYNKNSKPSVDRINDNLGYTLDNIQLMTWDQNNQKGYESRRKQ